MNAGSAVVVTNIPRPYRRALFNTVRLRLGVDALQLRVLYASDPTKHVRRGSVLPAIDDPREESFLRSVTIRLGYERLISIPLRLRQALRQSKPSCAVLGGFGIASLLGAGQCQTDGVPYAIWSGAWPRGEKRVSPLAAVIRKRLVRRASAFIAYGTAAAEYLVSLGAAPDRVFCAWNTVDLEDIASAASAAAAKRGELVTKYELAKRNLLFVGSLVERKGVRELIGAALIMEPDEPDWALHLVGAGPLREELEATTTAAGKEANFRFHGLRPPADVAELLGVANGFVLPTKREAWGLVINEAMACGVPVVTSPWAGATRDLITHGLTGYVVEPNDTRSLATVMSRLVSGDPVCAAVGQAGAEAIRAKASLERSAEGFVSAVKCALEGRRDD